MTTKEYQPFVDHLRKIDAFEVRENTRPLVQPDPIKRAIAVTELERRRQERAPATIKDPPYGLFIVLLGLAILALTLAYLVIG